MSDKNPNVVTAGEGVFTGIDEDEITRLELAIVIEFSSKEQLAKALQDRKVDFTLFE